MPVTEIDKTTGSLNPPITVALRSEILGEARKIYIQLPEGYGQCQRNYPVFIVLDGEWLFDIVRANLLFYSDVEVMGNILPKMILVGIENTDRDRDFVPTPDPQDPPMFKTAGKADIFAKFLSQELFPYLEHEYQVLPDRTVLGWSFSGLFALYAVVQLQDLFDNYLCLGPAIWWDNELVIRLFKETPLRNKKRAVITCGTDERGGEVYESVQNLLKFLEDEKPANFDFEYLEFDDVGHSWSVPQAIAQGLLHLFKGYVPKDEIKTTAALKEYYKNLSDLWGYDVIAPDWFLLDLMNRLWEADDRDSAFEVLEILLVHHPNSSLAHFYRGKYLALLNQMPEALESYWEALKVELSHPVPNNIYLRSYRKKFEEFSKTSN
ncbi:alpha/beta hydrolase [Chloroflexota bacterium]|nr:alpha/beta hydrolase [Chloroflexota bacterium]